MRDLEDAVTALTRPVVEHFQQTADDGKLIKLHSAELPCLFDQLYAAVAPGAETAAGSTSLASTRNLIDGDALFEHAKMASQIGDWCRMVFVRPTRHPAPDLKAWFDAYKHTDSDPDWYVSTLRRWRHVIEAILDKPKRFEVSLCPVCKSTTWTDEAGATFTHPILVEYKVPKDGAKIYPKATCRACDAEWGSFAAIEELGKELEEVAP
ncbi:DUF7341 domain-containing protein [Herbiconiux sp. YIM B11900]|uniref:DUF7341 domain-containing protein n=1 Tax=Herbiconiux sp. YIM B11900 TaxID=3404131 RepID=UPI003F85F757